MKTILISLFNNPFVVVVAGIFIRSSQMIIQNGLFFSNTLCCVLPNGIINEHFALWGDLITNRHMKSFSKGQIDFYKGKRVKSL